jgi:glycosidase
VRDEMTRWGKWYLDTTDVDGFRLDAIKHISSWFFPEWLDEVTSSPPNREARYRRGFPNSRLRVAAS